MLKDKIESSLSIAEHLFFLIEDGQILVWNYQNHEQYILEEDFFLELLKISKNNKYHNEKIAKELFEADLVTNQTFDSSEWGWDILSKIFHVGTKNIAAELSDFTPESFSKNYIDQCAALENKQPQMFQEKLGDLVILPTPDISLLNNISFLSVLKNRKTCRKFNFEFIKLNELSLILYCSFGLIHGNWQELDSYNLKETGIRKSSPSSGGIHSEEIYIAVYRVEGIKQGLYHYRPHDHKLSRLKEGDFEKKIIEINYNQFFSEGMSFGIYITSRLEKIWWKYKHSRSYKSMLLDIGHLSQTFLESSTALGMQTWLTGAFHDKQAEEFLDIQQQKECVILFVGAGKGNDQSIPSIMAEQLYGEERK